MLTPLFAFFFANPLALFFTAAGAVSVPIIIHLLNRKRFRIVNWAAMRFLLAAEKKKSRKMRLEQIILLCVRAGIVLLLLLAMASVTEWAEKIWDKTLPQGTVLGGPGGARAHRIIVLDGSLSMGVKDGETITFEKARRLAEEIIEKSPKGDGFSVVLMASSPRRLVGSAGPSEEGKKVIAELSRVRLPHGNSDLAGTLESVSDMLKQSPGKFSEKIVYFISDMQRGSWVLPNPGQASSALQAIQGRARTLLLDVGVSTPEPPDNIAITRLTLDPSLPVATKGAKVIFSITLYNYGKETTDEVRVTLKVGKPPRQAGDAPLTLTNVDTVSQRLGRGQQTLSFAHTFPSAGDFVVQASLEGDALDLDDTRTVVVPVRESVPVLLVNGKTAADRYDQATEYLLDALNPFQEGPAPALAPIKAERINLSDLADTGKSNFEKFDCVYLCDVARLSQSEVKRLEQHVLRGGGVVFTVGPNVVKDGMSTYNEMLFRNGQGLLPARLVGRQTAPAGWYFHFDAEKQSWAQPPLAAFTLDRDRTRLTNSPFHEFVRTELPKPADVPAPPRQVLSFLARPEKPENEKNKPNDPVLYQRHGAVLEWQPALPQPNADAQARRAPAPPGRGRVALFTSTVNTDWTEWPRQGSFVWFQQELLGHVCAARLRDKSAVVGETLEQYLTGGDAKEVTVHTPDDRKEETRTTPRDEGSVWRWSDTDVGGVYRAVVGSSPIEHIFAVNPPTASDNHEYAESKLVRTTEEELKRAYPEWDLTVVRDLTEAGGKGKVAAAGTLDTKKQKLGSGIARWLLLLALVLIVTEVILAWHFGHYSAVHEGQHVKDSWFQGSAGKALRIGVLVVAGLLFVFVVLTAVVLIDAAVSGDFLRFLPNSFRSSVEGRMNLPPPAAGESTRWPLEFLPYLWDKDTDFWLAGLIAAAILALVIFLYSRESKVATGGETGKKHPGKLILLVGLRIGLVLVVLGILLPQLRVWVERQSWPDIALIIDDSASMAEADTYRDTTVKEAAEKLAAQGNLARHERLALAQALLTRGDSDWIRQLLEKRQVKIHVYRCSSRASRIASVNTADEREAAIEEIRKLEARSAHDSSQLGACVRQVLNDFRGSSLAAVVMLTDGVTTEGEELGQVSKYAAQLKVPLFFVGIGDAQEARDLSVSDLEVADSVFVNDNLVFRLNVTVKGYGENPAPVKVVLREKDSKEELASQMVTPEAGGKPTKVRLDHRPTRAGEKTYVIEIPVREDEVDKDNNKMERDVFVSEARMLKVLYVEGYGGWEFRYLKTLLGRESDRVKGNKTMDVKVYLFEADANFQEQDKNALDDLPTRQALFQYDVVILGDVDPNPRDGKKVQQFLKDLADFVREKGGGLLMLAGERHSPHAYKESPLKDVLPIDITSDQPPPEPEHGRTEGYKPELTPNGRLHPIFSFNEKEPDQVYKKLKDFYWYAEGYVPKRAAEVLAVHPTKKGEAGGGKEAKHPLVLHQFIGAGRSMFLGFNEVWRWRWREDELRYNQFWIQTVRYLARSRQGRVELRLDKQTPYQRGEPIRVTVRLPDDKEALQADGDIRVQVLNKDLQERETMKLAGVGGVPGPDGKPRTRIFEGVRTRTPEGHYEFELTHSPHLTSKKPRAECRVLPPPGEKQRLQMNQADMEKAARETSGKFYTLADAGSLLDELPSGTRVTLQASDDPWLIWNHWIIVIVVILFLAAEWILRKRYHLL